MFELCVRSHFSAAHKIEGHKGKCQFLHGHNWKVEALFVAQETDDIGIAMDFSELKGMLNELIESMDHICLNDMPVFQGSTKMNPTAENISKYLFEELEKQLSTSSANVSKLSIWETDNCCASYYR